ncbi:NUDIX hydrolase [Flavimarina sp. Hel_I_48]|uniref:NUDIX hydrolase n=1 Tax=Flavimarina sp. Hel_I_48 TaxID=1392488 RepID=UPI00068E67E5|nr:NUDIX hydrolase [Flavimarina sp. Hel_I_48]
MIFKDRAHKKDKKIQPFTGILLFFVSILLLVITAPFGLLYGFFYNLFKNGLRGLGEYCLKMAISIDQLGNVAMQHLLNLLWLKKGAYRFGNRDETISSALGRNKKLGLLNSSGLLLDRILDALDPDHSLNSIDYYIEPTDQIIEKVAWIYLIEGRILTIKSLNEEHYHLPNGIKKTEETDAHTLKREIKRELAIDLITATMNPLGIFEGRANASTGAALVRINCYTAEFIGELIPEIDVSAIVWLTHENLAMVSQVDQFVFDFLKEKGLLL